MHIYCVELHCLFKWLLTVSSRRKDLCAHKTQELGPKTEFAFAYLILQCSETDDNVLQLL